MSYGERIRSARKARGWSQREVGERLGVPRRSVGNWEHGEAVPRPERREAVEELLGVEHPEDEGEPTPEHDHHVYVLPGTVRLFPGNYAAYGCRECPATWESPLTVEKLAGVECEAEQGRAA